MGNRHFIHFSLFFVFPVSHVLTAEYNDTYRQYEYLHII